MFLVEYADNYADEFDISGFIVTDKTHWDEFINRIATFYKENSEESFQFGSNEWIEYDSLSHVLENFTTREISREDFETLQKILPSEYSEPDYGLFYSRGFFPDFLEFCYEWDENE